MRLGAAGGRPRRYRPRHRHPRPPPFYFLLSTFLLSLPPRDCYFGGTFDPVHAGHLAIARAALASGEVARVVFLPALAPPHKGGRSLRPFAERLYLLHLACAADPRLVVSTLEAELPAPSYTARTLELLVSRGAAPPILLLMGADTLLDLPHWYHPERVVALARILAAPRPGVAIETLRAAVAPLLPGDAFDRHVRLLEMAPVACSATEIRRLLAHGLDPGALLPEVVRAALVPKPPLDTG
ncbi:MAG: nicotinate (nicotinamide) nucleotide adenylyltransferase [Nitrospirae bacterium CG_4_9_14_0_8_um_filter_70_14]|nr:MAG: nicotinate (nicotinamide) nucleotide adenylyltransferase [Nitrospirae bacterium CG_4_9_14_0_8_um_filter_70_14]